jgi:GTP-binding protein Era
VGRPNVGKSTLLNRLVGQKVSITSRKPQTTRNRVTGILTITGAQLVFVDTPGFQTQHRSALTRLMNRTVTQALTEVDVIVWLIEALKFDERDELLLKRLPDNVPVVLVLNKVDRVKEKSALLPFIAGMSARRAFEAIVPLSAERDRNADALVAEISRLLP